MSSRPVDFVLMLHSHLPYVLNHGRWPHGSDWLCEAALGAYLPLAGKLRQLERGDVQAPVTLGVTPVLANQLAHPAFAAELDRYIAQRLAACAETASAMAGTPEAPLLPLVAFWERRLGQLRTLRDEVGGDLIGEFRRLQGAGRLELTSSAATHAILPLLARDESIRLQLLVGRGEHRRLFGSDPAGCWLPECAYRPRGMWSPLPGAPNAGVRRGIEEHLAEAGYRYFFVDAHMANAGAPLGIYGELFAGESAHLPDPAAPDAAGRQSPHRAYRVTGAGTPVDVAALVRDPRATLAVWSRGHGYPGDGAYLEFHKLRWPGGLRLWGVTSRASGLGDKASYDPVAARLTARVHARDFAATLSTIADGCGVGDRVIAAPFDTELFGHWWFEGPDFLGDLYAELPHHPGVRAATASAHLDRHGAPAATRLARGSWGRNGDLEMWLNDRVQWIWPLIWELEEEFWALAPTALERDGTHELLAQAARSLLLLQSSDWPFIVSTGEVADYATRRVHTHAGETRELLGALRRVLGGSEARVGRALARALHLRDAVFPGIVPAIAAALVPARRDHAYATIG